MDLQQSTRLGRALWGGFQLAVWPETRVACGTEAVGHLLRAAQPRVLQPDA